MSSLKMTLPHYLILALTTRSAMGSKMALGPPFTGDHVREEAEPHQEHQDQPDGQLPPSPAKVRQLHQGEQQHQAEVDAAKQTLNQTSLSHPLLCK